MIFFLAPSLLLKQHGCLSLCQLSFRAFQQQNLFFAFFTAFPVLMINTFDFSSFFFRAVPSLHRDDFEIVRRRKCVPLST